MGKRKQAYFDEDYRITTWTYTSLVKEKKGRLSPLAEAGKSG